MNMQIRTSSAEREADWTQYLRCLSTEELLAETWHCCADQPSDVARRHIDELSRRLSCGALYERETTRSDSEVIALVEDLQHAHAHTAAKNKELAYQAATDLRRQLNAMRHLRRIEAYHRLPFWKRLITKLPS